MTLGHQEEPLKLSEKITSATLIDNILLADSYKSVSMPLSTLPAILGVGDVEIGDFSQFFNETRFQYCCGPFLLWNEMILTQNLLRRGSFNVVIF